MSKCKIRKIYVTNWNWGLHLKYTTQMAPQTPQLDVSLENSEPSERSGTQWCTAHGALVSGGHSPKLAVLWCFMVENGNSLSLGHPIFRHTQLDFLMFNKYTHIISLFGQCILAGVFFIPSLLVFVLGENPIWGVAKATTIAQLGVHSADLWGRQVQYPTDLLDGLALRIGNFKKGASLEIGYTGLYRAIPGYTTFWQGKWWWSTGFWRSRLSNTAISFGDALCRSQGQSRRKVPRPNERAGHKEKDMNPESLLPIKPLNRAKETIVW